MSRAAAHYPAWAARLKTRAPFLTLVRREFVRMLRGTRPFVYLVVLVCTAGVLVIANYPPAGVTPYVMGSYNKAMVSSLVVSLFVAAMVLLPAYGAASIQTERSRNTYDLLTLTLIRPSGIVFAKIVSTLGYFCLLIVSVLPFLGVSFFLLGVDWQAIIQSGIIILTAAITCAILGVAASALCRGPIAAVFLGYFATLFFAGGYLLGLLLFFGGALDELSELFGTWTEEIFMSIALTSPVFAIFLTLAQELPWWGSIPTVVGQSIVWGAAFVIAARRLRKPVEPPQPLDIDEFPEPALSGAPKITSWIPGQPVADNVNPVCVRELRWGTAIGGDRGLAIAGIAGVLLLVIGFMVFSETAPSAPSRVTAGVARGYVAFCLSLLMAATFLLTPGLAAVSIATERDRDGLDALYMTTLSPRSILWGKTSAVLRFSIRPLLIGALPLLFAIRFLVTDLPTATVFLTGAVTVGITVLMCGAIGVWASVRAKATSGALLTAYGLSGLAVLGPVVLHSAVVAWTSGRSVGLYDTGLLLLTPISSYVVMTVQFIKEYDISHVVLWFIFSVFHLIGIALIYYQAERRFARMVTGDG